MKHSMAQTKQSVYLEGDHPGDGFKYQRTPTNYASQLIQHVSNIAKKVFSQFITALRRAGPEIAVVAWLGTQQFLRGGQACGAYRLFRQKWEQVAPPHVQRRAQ
jgi:hypothetical protein